MTAIPSVIRHELLEISGRIGDNKALGPVEVRNKTSKLVVKSRPDMFAELFEVCMSEGIFPATWKRQKLVLLPKPGKFPGGSSDRQYPFRKARDTIDTTKLVTGLAEDAIHGKGSTSKHCVVVTLKMKDAFNPASWNLIHKSLVKVSIPINLTDIFDIYLFERKL